jgi:plasmid stabilization system protein ParE
VRVELSNEAERDVLRIDEWWRAERDDSPDLFETELSVTIKRIELSPRLGTVYEQNEVEETVHRMLMPRTRHHLYYVVLSDVVFVLSVWGAMKERGPMLVQPRIR